MRVLTVVTETAPIRSGIAAAVDRLTAGLRVLGHTVDTVTAADVGRRQLGEVRLTGLVRHWPQLRRRLQGCDVVHLHGPAPTFSDAFFALWTTVPRHRRPGLVYTHHSDISIEGAMPMCALYNRVHRLLARTASHVVVSTPSYSGLVGHELRRRAEVIPFGIDRLTPPVAKRARGRLRVAFVGQLRPYKGVDVLIRAAAELPDVVFHVAGTGHQEQALRALAAELGVANVSFHGAVSDARREEILRDADVVALPSRTRAEAFGIVLLEGMRAGAVPIASDLPGVRDIAGRTGLLVQPGSARSLVQAICHLRDDPGERQRRSRASIELAAAFRWDVTVREYHRVLADAAMVRRLHDVTPWRLDGAMALMREAALAERASLLVVDEATEELRLASVSGHPVPGFRSGAAVDHDSFARRALLAGAPYVVSDATTPLGVRRQPDAHAGLCVPFSLHGGTTRGVVSFTRHRALDFLPHEVGWMSERVGRVAARVLLPSINRWRADDGDDALAAIA